MILTVGVGRWIYSNASGMILIEQVGQLANLGLHIGICQYCEGSFS
jgi:hypothetical protein